MKSLRRPKRLGSVYITILMASLLVASAAAAAILTSNRVVRLELEEGNTRSAQLLADSALEWAIAYLNNDSSWRTNLKNNVDVAPVSFQGGTITFRVVETDGLLADDSFDLVDVIAVGRLGNASHAWRATLEPTGSGASGLAYTIAARKSIALTSSAAWTTNESIAGQSISAASGSVLTANCSALSAPTGTITGASSIIAAVPEIPGTSALDAYSSIAVKLDLNQLRLVGSERRITGQLLSTGDNSLGGAVNPKGVYTIDCAGSTIRIQNSRLVATLILKNAASVILSDSLVWEAPKGNYPILLTDSPITLAVNRVPLDESSTVLNLNPLTTPYRGLTDSNLTTSYPSQLRGLIYTNATVTVDAAAETEIQGLIQCDSISGGGDLLMEHRDTFRSAPPRGFRKSNQMTLIPGSVRRTTLP